MLMTDLRELKKVLEIDNADTSEDSKLLFFIEHISNWMEEWCGRDFTYKSRTEFYKGSGTQKLLLRARPVYPAPSGSYSQLTVYEDEAGYFGTAPDAFSSDALTYGEDYTLDIDQDNGSSRSAILYRINGYWTRPWYRQRGLLSPFLGTDLGSYKVTYTAGYTVDTLPAVFREATNLGVARLRYVWPLGLPLSSESYEERSISVLGDVRGYMFSMVKDWIFTMKNWKF